jgi:hypothetical protein
MVRGPLEQRPGGCAEQAVELELILDRTRHEARAAILQFAARRSFSLGRQLWWAKGIRITAPKPPSAEAPAGQESAPSTVSGIRKTPGSRPPHWLPLTVTVDLFRQLGKTVLRFRTDDQPDSVQLVYAIHAYLQDDRSYRLECPATCPSCSAAVMNMQAKYCGQCGGRLVPHEEHSPPAEADTSGPTAAPANEPAAAFSTRDQHGLSESRT